MIGSDFDSKFRERGISAAASPEAQDIGLLMLRLAVGLTVAAHGGQKLFGWFGGGGIEGTGQFFAASGYPSAKLFAVLAGLTETLGGLGMALGLVTPLAAAAVAGDLLNAVAVKWSGGFFAPQGMEFELLIAVCAVAVALAGPGTFAADRYLPQLRTHRLAYGVAALILSAVLAGVVLVIRG